MISDTIGMSDYYSPSTGHSFRDQYRGVSILDVVVSFLQIQFGSGAMLSIIFNVYKFGISVGFFDRTWKLTDFDSADGVL